MPELTEDPTAGPVYARKVISGDRIAWVIPLIMGTARIITGRDGDVGIFDSW